MMSFKLSNFAQGSALLSFLVLGTVSLAATENTAWWVSGTNVNLRSAASIESDVLKLRKISSAQFNCAQFN
jgi:hypothetical protein